MGVYAIHWGFVTVTDSTGITCDQRYTEHSWDRIPLQYSVDRQGRSHEWEDSGERWAHVFVDWNGPGRIEESMTAYQVLQLAIGGAAGFRLVAAGRDSGLDAPGGSPPPVDRWRSQAAASPSRGELPGQGRFAWG